MAIHTLQRRWRTGPLARVEAGSLGQAVERASHAGASLAYADLKGLRARGLRIDGADLRGADLVEADLAAADLRSADFRTALLVDADLRRADLRGARFEGADLRGALLAGARLDGASLDWRHPAFAIELLRRDRGCTGEALALVVELAMEADPRPFAWLRTLLRDPAVAEWAVGVLRPAVARGDGAPEVLRRLAADVGHADPAPTPAESTGRLYWTRARGPRR